MINATNEGGPAGIIYTVSSPECPDVCSGTTCGCTACGDIIPGCVTCKSRRECTTCDTSLNRMFDPVNGQCICSEGFYENPSKECVPCPPSCRTCRFMSVSTEFSEVSRGIGFATATASLVRDRVECTSCSRERYRRFNDRTKNCDCIDGYQQSKCTVSVCVPTPRP